jgi:hypothetical protein
MSDREVFAVHERSLYVASPVPVRVDRLRFVSKVVCALVGLRPRQHDEA